MAKIKDEDFVTFLNSAGEIISNDPRYKAKKLLAEAGDTADDGELRDALSASEQENQSLREQLAALQAQAASGVEDLGEDDGEDEDEDDFSTMNGKELQAYAKENGHDIKGLKTVGEVRARLRELTAAE